MKTAFVMAMDKKKIPELATALHVAEYGIVSLGRTAQLIEQTGIPVIRTAAFLGRIGLENMDNLPDSLKRESIAGKLAQSMALQRQELKRLGYPVIDLAYVNPMPAEVLYDRERRYTGTKTDKSSINIIYAAIEGGRPILVEPTQIPEYIAYLEVGLSPASQLRHNQLLAVEALEYLQNYNTKTLTLASPATGSH